MATKEKPRGRWVIRLAQLSLVFLAAGPLGVHVGLWAPMVGFASFLLGLLVALVAAGGAAVVLVRRTERQRVGLWAILLLGAAIGTFLAVRIVRGRTIPRINDITTSFDDPPKFVALARVTENATRDMGYPKDFAEEQQAGYPDIRPLFLEAASAEVFTKAVALAEGEGWDIVAVDANEGRIEAVERSRIFRFGDDVVVRVRSGEPRVVVDMRSKSRDGKGDFGVNAARIQRFLSALGRVAVTRRQP